MRIVGKRKEPPITFYPSAENFMRCAKFNDEMNALRPNSCAFYPKGVFRFKTHAEANEQQERAIAQAMAAEQLRLNKFTEPNPVKTLTLDGLLRTKQTTRDKDISDRHILERAIAEVKRQQLVRPPES